MSLEQFKAWAFEEHDTTLRLLAQQEREDAARELPPPVDPSHEWMLIVETGGNQLYREEVKRAERELTLVLAGLTAPDRADRRRLARACVRGRRGSRRVALVPPDLAIPSPYGSADVAPTNATLAPDFGDPDAIRIQCVEAKVDHMRAFLDEVPLAPLEPTEGEVKP